MGRVALVVMVLMTLPSIAAAQEPRPAPLAPTFLTEAVLPIAAPGLLDPGGAAEAEREGMPAWLKWGLVGGVGLGAASALLSGYGSSIGGPSRGEAAVTGFAVGFVVVGGAVAVYQAVCRPDGWSRRHGLCG